MQRMSRTGVIRNTQKRRERKKRKRKQACMLYAPWLSEGLEVAGEARGLLSVLPAGVEAVLGLLTAPVRTLLASFTPELLLGLHRHRHSRKERWLMYVLHCISFCLSVSLTPRVVPGATSVTAQPLAGIWVHHSNSSWHTLLLVNANQ